MENPVIFSTKPDGPPFDESKYKLTTHNYDIHWVDNNNRSAPLLMETPCMQVEYVINNRLIVMSTWDTPEGTGYANAMQALMQHDDDVPDDGGIAIALWNKRMVSAFLRRDTAIYIKDTPFSSPTLLSKTCVPAKGATVKSLLFFKKVAGERIKPCICQMLIMDYITPPPTNTISD